MSYAVKRTIDWCGRVHDRAVSMHAVHALRWSHDGMRQSIAAALLLDLHLFVSGPGDIWRRPLSFHKNGRKQTKKIPPAYRQVV